MVIFPFLLPLFILIPSRESFDSLLRLEKVTLRVDDASPIFDKPMKPATAFPRECDNEVGGVLMMLLEPAVVDSIVEDIEEEEDDVEGDSGLGTRTVERFFPEVRRESDLLVGTISVRGAVAEIPLGNPAAPELRLFAVPLAVMAPDPVNFDICICAT